MSDPTDTPEQADLGDLAVGDELSRLRPVPGARFRGALQRYLVSIDPGYGPRPQNLRRMAAGWILLGAALLLAGAIAAGGII